MLEAEAAIKSPLQASRIIYVHVGSSSVNDHLVTLCSSCRVLGCVKRPVGVFVVARVQFPVGLLLLVSETIYRASFLNMIPSRLEGLDLKIFGVMAALLLVRLR